MEIVLNPVNHIALEFIVVRDALPFHQGTAFRAVRPFLLAGLVSSDVDVVRRKDLHYLVKDIFKEFVGLRVSGTEFTACVGPTLAAQLRMGDENCIGMCREFDFGDYLDVVRSGIFYYFPEFILGVITAIGIRSTLVKIALVLLVPPLDPTFLRAEGTFGCKLRVTVEFHSPSTVVCQMKVKIIHLVAGHLVQQKENFLLGKKMSRNIQMESPVRKAGSIFYPDTRQTLVRQYLQQGLDSVESSVLI